MDILSVAFKLALVLFLIFMNGFFVAAEFAVVKIRTSRLEMMIQDGNKRAKYAKMLTDHLDASLSVTQLGITLASLGLGWVGEPVVAPDGRSLAFTVTSTDLPAVKRWTNLWRVDADGKNARALTFLDKRDASPDFSPDGATLAFLSTRSGAPLAAWYLRAVFRAHSTASAPELVKKTTSAKQASVRRLARASCSGIR